MGKVTNDVSAYKPGDRELYKDWIITRGGQGRYYADKPNSGEGQKIGSTLEQIKAAIDAHESRYSNGRRRAIQAVNSKLAGRFAVVNEDVVYKDGIYTVKKDGAFFCVFKNGEEVDMCDSLDKAKWSIDDEKSGSGDKRREKDEERWGGGRDRNLP